MFEESIRYPLTGEEGTKSLVIGTLLSLFSVLLVPAFFVMGYLVRVLRTSIDGSEDAPVYDEWGDLLVDGLKAFAIGLVYFAVPIVLLIAVVGSALVVTVVESSASSGTIASTTSSSSAAGGILIFLGLLALSVVTLLVATYVFPAGLARFATTGSMGSAFAFRSLWPVLTSGSYAVAWLLAVVVSLAAGFVAGFVSFVPILGALVAIAVGYYANVVGFRLYAMGYAEATQVDRAPEPPVGQPAA